MFKIVRKSDSDFPLMCDFVKTKIRALCKGGVNRSYIVSDALPHAHALVMAYEETQTRHKHARTNVLGFAIVKKKPKFLYLDVICAQKVGSKLLEQVVKLAREWKVNSIQIASVPAAMPYWLKMGFVNHRSKCEWDPDLVESASTVVKTQVKPGKTNKVIQTYLNKLVSKKLGIDKDCKSVRDCSVDGYVMTLCIDNFGKKVELSTKPSPSKSRSRSTTSTQSLRRSSRLSKRR